MNLIIIFGAKYLIWIVLAFVGYVFLRLSREDKVRVAKLALIALPVAYGAALVCGHLYYDPRPFVVGHFTPVVAHADDNGFPSDHALLLSSLAMMFYFYSKKESAVIWAGALIVSAARVFAGVHHPIDIAGSFAISIIVGFIVHVVSSGWIDGSSSQKTV